MKTIKLLALTAMLCTAAACNDDDLDITRDNGVGPENAGIYNLTKVMVFDPVDFNMDEVANNDLMLESPCYGGSRIVLNEDGTYEYSNNNVFFESETGCSFETIEGTWEVEGSDILMTATTVDVPLTTEHDFNGTEIIIVRNNGTYPTRDAEDNPVYATGNVTYTYTKS